MPTPGKAASRASSEKTAYGEPRAAVSTDVDREQESLRSGKGPPARPASRGKIPSFQRIKNLILLGHRDHRQQPHGDRTRRQPT